MLPGGPGAASRGAYFGHSSVASSVVAEATEASLLDSLQDGVSSLDEGSLDGHGSRRAPADLVLLHQSSPAAVRSLAPKAGMLKGQAAELAAPGGTGGSRMLVGN